MANKELYNVLVDITLKPYGHTETQESVEVFVEDVANLSTSEEDVAVALGKLHAWYTNFTPWVFKIPDVVTTTSGDGNAVTSINIIDADHASPGSPIGEIRVDKLKTFIPKEGYHNIGHLALDGVGTPGMIWCTEFSHLYSQDTEYHCPMLYYKSDNNEEYLSSNDLMIGWAYTSDLQNLPSYINLRRPTTDWISYHNTGYTRISTGYNKFYDFSDEAIVGINPVPNKTIIAVIPPTAENQTPTQAPIWNAVYNYHKMEGQFTNKYVDDFGLDYVFFHPDNSGNFRVLKSGVGTGPIVTGNTSYVYAPDTAGVMFGTGSNFALLQIATAIEPYPDTGSELYPVGSPDPGTLIIAGGHFEGTTSQLADASPDFAWGIHGTSGTVYDLDTINTDTKVTQNITSASNIYPLLLSYYTTSSSTTTAQTVNRSNYLAFKPSTGYLYLNRKGSYILTKDSSNTDFGLICYNGANMWIGSLQQADHHHTGKTYISAGYDTDSSGPNPTIYVSIPNATNTDASNYGVLHEGNTYFSTSSNASTWEAIGITKAGYALHIYRGNGASSTPPYCAGAYAPGLVYGGGDTKGFISNAYNSAKVTFGGGERKSSDTSAKAPTWYFSLTGTTATTYNLDNFALAADYLPLAGGTMDSGATVTVYTDQAETQGIQYTSTGQRFKIASGVGWARSVMAYKGAFSGDIIGGYGIYGTSDSFTNNRMNYFYIGKAYNDQWYEFGYGKFTVVDNDLYNWMLRYRYPWTSGSSTGTYEGSFISLYPYDRYGCCLVVGENTGGLTLIGGGEAAQQLRTTITDASTSPYGAALSYGTESLMMGADADLYFVSGANSLTTSAHTEGTNLKTFIWSNSGTLRPWNDDTYSIGAAAKRWNYGYFTNISGKLIGTIDSSTTATTQTLPNVTSRVATCQFAWNLYNNSGIFYNDNTDATTAQNNPWQCIAEATVTASGNTYISTTFLIDSAFSSYPGTGIVHFRASIKLTAAESYCVYTLKWLTSDTNVNDSTIVFTYKVVSNTSCTVKVWAKAAKRYEAIHIHPLYEATRAAARTSEFWTYNVNSSGVASIPSDEHVMTSTTKQVLLHESASSTATSLECTVTNLFKIWQVVYVCIQNLSYGSGSNPMSINFLVPLGYVKAKSNYNTAVGTSTNPGYYAGEGYNPSNTGTNHARMLVQWKNDNTIVFTNDSGNRMGVVRIYGIS